MKKKLLVIMFATALAVFAAPALAKTAKAETVIPPFSVVAYIEGEDGNVEIDVKDEGGGKASVEILPGTKVKFEATLSAPGASIGLITILDEFADWGDTQYLSGDNTATVSTGFTEYVKYDDDTTYIINISAFVFIDDLLTPTLDISITFKSGEPELPPPPPVDNLVRVTPSASVTKDKGNTNTLRVIVTEIYESGKTETFTGTFTINNNTAGAYYVGEYLVYVDTKGNDQIRACYIVG